MRICFSQDTSLSIDGWQLAATRKTTRFLESLVATPVSFVQRSGQLRSINRAVTCRKSATLGNHRRNLRETTVLGIASTKVVERYVILSFSVYYCTVTSIDRLIQTFRKHRRVTVVELSESHRIDRQIRKIASRKNNSHSISKNNLHL